EDLPGGPSLIQPQSMGAGWAPPALQRVKPIFGGRPPPRGAGGRVGFENAHGMATATASSDLDLILRQNSPLEPNEAADLLAALANAAAPARIDVMLETPHGGISLADLA